MAQYDHLKLVRRPEQLERRKRPGFGASVARDPGAHSQDLQRQLDEVVQRQRAAKPRSTVDPSLILRVTMTGSLLEEDWEKLGLVVLSTDADKTLVLFSSTDEMTSFRQRLSAYGGGTAPGKKNPPYAGFVSSIEKIGEVEARDRIGVKLRESGVVEPSDFGEHNRIVDVELWDIGSRALRESRVSQIEVLTTAGGGEVLDRYVGPSITIVRVEAPGTLLAELLTLPDVATIDLPPSPDLETSAAMELSLEDVPEIEPLSPDAPVIGVLDSGVNSHPLIEDALVGAIGVPETLGRADVWGHGTRVAGIATFGDLRAQLFDDKLRRVARLCSAKVTNDKGDFDDRKLVPKLIREAIETLNHEHGCRVFVHSLADRKMPFSGGKVGAWAATLDELARELDVVIVVATGNRSPRGGDELEEAVTEYPKYLIEPAQRLYEPSSALNVLSVGALAHGEGVDESAAEYAVVRPITQLDEPSPFTCTGPGVGGATKPDLVDYGGTLVFDPVPRKLHDGASMSSAGLVTLNHQPVRQLFTSASGTSYAAPLVAFKVAQLLRRLPAASANLLRALVVNAARVPEAAQSLLKPLGKDVVAQVCGRGQVRLESAAFSDDSRVVLYAEDELVLDYFAVYEVPVPDVFQKTKGRRSISVALAFDPPVRHTRTDYAGTKMSFRLVRGMTEAAVFEHYRKRSEAEGDVPELPSRNQCNLEPGPQQRERSTVQSARVVFQRDISQYGEHYYLVVRCEAGWAGNLPEQKQRFAVLVELSHEAQIPLYQRVRLRQRA